MVPGRVLRSTGSLSEPEPFVQFDATVSDDQEGLWTPMLAAGDIIEAEHEGFATLTIVRHIATGSAGEIYEAVRQRPAGSVAVLRRLAPS